MDCNPKMGYQAFKVGRKDQVVRGKKPKYKENWSVYGFWWNIDERPPPPSHGDLFQMFW